MYSFENDLLEGEEIVYKGSPSLKHKLDIMTMASMFLVILMEVILYVSIRNMLSFDMIKAVLIILFLVEDIYLYFSLKSKKLKKIKQQARITYCVTTKRIMIHNSDSNELMIEKIENCYEVIAHKNNDLYDIEFLDDNNNVILTFKSISSNNLVEKINRLKKGLTTN